VVTYGFPSPEIASANVDNQGKFLGGGDFFLKGHANEGVVAGQYETNGAWLFEFNVGWFHGESGGPVVQHDRVVAVFAVMQGYRKIQTPDGVVMGPRIGRGLDAVQQALVACGATIV